MHAIGTQPIRTDRLLLRRFCAEDAEDMFANWCNDPDVTRYLSWKPHGDKNFTGCILASWILAYENACCFHWAIEQTKSGQAIGAISLLNVDEALNQAEIGYVLGKPFWGNGYMTEACAAVVRYAFDRAGFDRLYARHHIDNSSSGRVLTRCGLLPTNTVYAPWVGNPSIRVWYQNYEMIRNA